MSLDNIEAAVATFGRKYGRKIGTADIVVGAATLVAGLDLLDGERNLLPGPTLSEYTHEEDVWNGELLTAIGICSLLWGLYMVAKYPKASR